MEYFIINVKEEPDVDTDNPSGATAESENASEGLITDVFASAPVIKQEEFQIECDMMMENSVTENESDDDDSNESANNKLGDGFVREVKERYRAKGDTTGPRKRKHSGTSNDHTTPRHPGVTMDLNTHSETARSQKNVKLDKNETLKRIADSNGEMFTQLISKWGFDYKINELREQGITLESLHYLMEPDIVDLFKNDKIGLRAQFRHCVLTWRKEQANDNLYSDSRSGNSECVNRIQRWQQQNSTIDSQPSTSALAFNRVQQAQQQNSTIDSSPCFQPRSTWELAHVPNDFDITNMLEEHPTGDYVLKLNKLDDIARKILVEAIVGWHIKRKLKISRQRFSAISLEIERRFNDDRSIYYSKDPVRSRPGGRLYDRFNNVFKRVKKEQTPVQSVEPA